MTKQKVRVVISLVKTIDTEDYIDREEEGAEEPTVSEAIAQFEQDLEDGTEDLDLLLATSDPTIEVVQQVT